ncbi:ABC transporter permease [Actinomadura sp. WMMA1423]|uniref:ABC transporter permease n=1 Tax=Actinomadura sp. WMMA1423 TaxID=2591108 RepID=UPI00197AE6A6|nr:ABC transporter permease [Actinomadura sp. WMMA1423]
MSTIVGSALVRKLPKLRRETVLLIVLLAEITLFSLSSPYFLNLQNMLDTSRFFAESGLIAMGMTLVIVTGGIDLSVGSLLALVSVTVGFSYAAGMPPALALAAGVAVGAAGGLLNGILVAGLGLSPLTVTLGTFSLFRGLAYIVSDADAVSRFPDWFAYLGQYYIGGVVPGQLVVFVIVAIAIWLVLERSRFGRYVFGLGINPRTARMSGVPVLKTRCAVYVILGVLVAIAAIIYTSRVSTARGNAGLGLELQAIAAVVLGGADVKGGSGSIAGIVLSILILAFLAQGMTLSGMSSSFALFVQGAVLIAAVLVNEVTQAKRS